MRWHGMAWHDVARLATSTAEAETDRVGKATRSQALNKTARWWRLRAGRQPGSQHIKASNVGLPCCRCVVCACFANVRRQPAAAPNQQQSLSTASSPFTARPPRQNRPALKGLLLRGANNPAGRPLVLARAPHVLVTAIGASP